MPDTKSIDLSECKNASVYSAKSAMLSGRQSEREICVWDLALKAGGRPEKKP
jgi:hypothetical protein